MNKLFLLCCGLLSICQAEPGLRRELPNFAGVWQGFGKQDDGSNWSVIITIDAELFLIQYPSLNCGGLLKLIKENIDHSLVFQEDLKYGLESCYNNGKTVLIKTTDNKVRYYWYLENGKKAAAGTLTRTAIFNPAVRVNLI